MVARQARTGERFNHEPSSFKYAAWITTAICLSLILNLSLTLTQNQFFFIAHRAQPWEVALILLLSITALTTTLWLCFSLLGRISKATTRRNWQCVLAWILLFLVFTNIASRNTPALANLGAAVPDVLSVLGALILAALAVSGFFLVLQIRGEPTTPLWRSGANLLRFRHSRQWLFVSAAWIMLSGLLLVSVIGSADKFATPVVLLALAGTGASFGLLAIQHINSSVAILVIGSATSVAPLVQLQFEYEGAEPTTVAAEMPSATPDVLWVVVDELQYPVLFDDTGRVRENFPNLRAFQESATTYSETYTAATFTDFAIPAILHGASDLNALSDDELRAMQRGRGLLESIGGRYSLATFSQWFNGGDRDQAASETGALNLGEMNLNPLETRDLQSEYDLPLLVADTFAVFGATALANPVAQLFPNLEGQWSNFWNPSEASVSSADMSSITRRLAETNNPIFAFWHDMDVHWPQTKDFSGRDLPRFDLGDDPGGSAKSGSLTELHKRLYLAEVQDMDKQFGSLLAQVASRPNDDGLMVIFTADHGRTFTTGDVRYGDETANAWGEVGRVPLMVQYPFQDSAVIADGVRSVGQIVPTIYEVLGISPESAFMDSPPLQESLPLPPIPYGWEESSRDAWCSPDCRRDSDIFWSAETLASPQTDNPWAVGIDPAVLGRDIETGQDFLQVSNLEITEGDAEGVTHLTLTSNSECALSGIPALVSLDGTIAGSILWENSDSSQQEVRGWGLLPGKASSSEIAFHCSK